MSEVVREAIPGAVAVGKPLTDQELDRIPVTKRDVRGGLTRGAKDEYRAMRRFARGGVEMYAKPSTIGEALDVSADTEKRQRDELLAKGYLEPTGRNRGRATEYRLLRGEVEVYRLRSPQSAGREPQTAGHIEESRTEEESAYSALSPPRSKKEAAASPSPPEGGSAAAEEEAPRRRKTGYRFVRASSGASGTYVRDSEGTDAIPPGYFAPVDRPPKSEVVDLLELEPDDVRRKRAAELRERMFGKPWGEPLGAGECSECKLEALHRSRLGTAELCTPCMGRRQRAAVKVAAEVVAAEST